MESSITNASDGRRLIQITYEGRFEDTSKSPVLKTTFEIYTPEDFTLKANTQALFHLSTVRMDTMENVSIDRSFMREVMNFAVTEAAEDDPDW